jgi:trimethylamine:corrinoid methyltransferase-like protein
MGKEKEKGKEKGGKGRGVERERQGRQALIAQASPQLNNNKCPIGKLDTMKTHSSENIRKQSMTLVEET